jgi:capsular exopolysaccharide synthesis family protein
LINHFTRKDGLEPPHGLHSSLRDTYGRHGDDLFDLRRIVQRLLKRAHLVGLVLLVVVIPTAIASLLATPLYRSVALVEVNPDPVRVLPYNDVADTAGGVANIDNYMGTQEQVLRGATLKARVRKRIDTGFKDHPAAQEISQLSSRFGVRKIEKSQLFELSYLAENPEAAATVVNLFAEEFAKQNFEMRQATRMSAEQSLKEELSALEQRLQLSEDELMRYAQANDIMSLEQGQVDPLQQRLSSLTQQVVEAEGVVAVARANLESAQKASLEEFPQRLMTPEIGQLQSRVFGMEQDLASLRIRLGENWPTVVQKRNEVVLARQQLENEKAAALARFKQQARLDMEGADARRRIAADALAEQKALVNNFHDASAKYNILKRDVDTNRNLYDGLLARLRQTGVLAGFQFGNIQLVEQGRPSSAVFSPRVMWNLGIAVLLGLSLGVCLVLVLDTWDTSIASLEEAESVSLLPLLGGVPLIKGASARALLVSSGESPASAGPSRRRGESPGVSVTQSAMVPVRIKQSLPFELEESMRSICASILLSRSDDRPHIIVVTSSSPGEGKTTVAAHLGTAFAEAGLRTLLVEADLRKPDLSRVFGVDASEGLSLFLAGLVSPSARIRETAIPNLSVAPGGPVPPNPAALLHSDRLASFLQSAAAEYQIVIIDTPPVLTVADARIIGKKADGIVLVVRAGHTARNLVRRTRLVLENSGVPVLGMVLNAWLPDRMERSHYRYYGQRAKSA